MTRRPASWQAEKARTKKALRQLPKCSTPTCDGKAIATGWGSDLCWKCQMQAQRAQRERR